MSARDPKALCDWYRKHLGIDAQDWGGAAFTCCNVLEQTDDSEYGKFGRVMDPEDNKVERWQPRKGQ